MSRPFIVISVCDIQQIIPNFEVSWLSEHKSDARALLHNIGLDTEFGIEVQEGLEHRSKFCGITTSHRIVGLERLDTKWLQSGNASYEASMYSNDKTMAKEISRLKKTKFEIIKNKENE